MTSTLDCYLTKLTMTLIRGHTCNLPMYTIQFTIIKTWQNIWILIWYQQQFFIKFLPKFPAQ